MINITLKKIQNQQNIKYVKMETSQPMTSAWDIIRPHNK